MYEGFETNHYDVLPPKNLITFDLIVYGVYVGMDFMIKDTGYDVYGYSEKLGTWSYKIGPSFKVSTPSKWNFSITLYAGAIVYSLFDASNNAIGARDDYGILYWVVGYLPYMIGII